MAELTPDNPQYYVRDPKTGLSQAQIDANKAVAEAASTAGYSVLKGATGTDATASRVVTPYTGGNTYMGKTYATTAGAYAAAVRAQESAGAPSAAPAGTHWTLQGTQWKLYDAYGRPVDPKNPVLLAPPGTITTTSTNTSANSSETGTFEGNGSEDDPLTKDGKPFTGVYNGKRYVGGRLASSSTSSTTTSTTATTSQGYEERKSAYDLLYQQFAKYGLQALVTPLESLIKEGVPASEFAIRLRETDAYQRRFAANKARINKGLAALSEAEYIGLEDQYQNIMRQYGMPESYYARGDMGIQQGFEKLIAGDVSAVELENRISTAYNRVINSNPEVVQALKQYYPNITNGDILSYVLDPEKALTDINKKVTAAEIGGAALGAGLGIDVARAEQLGAFGVSKAQAQQGYQTIAEVLPTEMKLSNIYRRQGLGPYDQAAAEAEVFGLTGAAEAAKKRKQYTQLETAQFSGQTGVGALARERAGQF